MMAEIVNLRLARKRKAEAKNGKRPSATAPNSAARSAAQQDRKPSASARPRNSTPQAGRLMPRDLETLADRRRAPASLSPRTGILIALAAAAKRRQKPLAALVAEIDKTRGGRNLSSAIRVWLLKTLQQ
jgi:hypothetical protein